MRRIILIFVLSRIGLGIIGVLSLSYSGTERPKAFHFHQQQPGVIEIWERWDSEWFLLIADKGYQSEQYFLRQGNGLYIPQETAHFFPVYPMAIRCATFLLRNPNLAGLLISNGCAVIFLYYFFLQGTKIYDEKTAVRSSLLYIFFPLSFFLSAVYAESLLLASLMASFYYLDQKRLLPACFATAIAVLSRPVGVLAAPALLWLCWDRMAERQRLSVIALFASICIPLLAYGLFIQSIFGSFMWVVHGATKWRGEAPYLFYAFLQFPINQAARAHGSWTDYFFALLSVAILVFSFRKIPKYYWLYSLIYVAYVLSATVWGYARYSLVNFPLFMFLGNRLEDRVAVPVYVGSSVFLVWFMSQFATWRWVS